jgi:hypothetical protein
MYIIYAHTNIKGDDVMDRIDLESAMLNMSLRFAMENGNLDIKKIYSDMCKLADVAEKNCIQLESMQDEIVKLTKQTGVIHAEFRRYAES